MHGALEICTCGHLRDQHPVGCIHINRRRNFILESEVCKCALYRPAELGDTEVFLAKTLNKLAAKEGIPLEQVERDDLLQVMRIALWGAARKYDSRSHITFGSFAAFEVYNDAIDEMRSSRMFGRQGQYRVQPALAGAADDDNWNIDPADPLDDDATGSRRLDRVVAELTVDPPDVGDVVVRWALTEADRGAVRVAAVSGLRADHRAAHRAGEPAWNAGLTALIATRGAAA
jgi:DNA-directed RNA polymerase specialized sigma24 family protein